MPGRGGRGGRGRGGRVAASAIPPGVSGTASSDVVVGEALELVLGSVVPMLGTAVGVDVGGSDSQRIAAQAEEAQSAQAPSQPSLAVCSSCHQAVGREAFSRAQLAKGPASRRCKQCTAGDTGNSDLSAPRAPESVGGWVRYGWTTGWPRARGPRCQRAGAPVLHSSHARCAQWRIKPPHRVSPAGEWHG